MSCAHSVFSSDATGTAELAMSGQRAPPTQKRIHDLYMRAERSARAVHRNSVVSVSITCKAVEAAHETHKDTGQLSLSRC
jgi:hypothetical protein